MNAIRGEEGRLAKEPLVVLELAVKLDRGSKPFNELLLWLGSVIPVAKVLFGPSASVVVATTEVVLDSIPSGTVEELVCVRIIVTIPTKLLT